MQRDSPTSWLGAPSRAVDLGVAIGAGIIEFVGTHVASLHAQNLHRTGIHQWDALGVVLLGVGPVLLVVRRRWPVAVLAGTFAATLAYSTIGYVPGPIWMALIVAFVTAIITGHRRASQVTLVAGYVGFLWLRPALGRGGGPAPQAALGLLAWLLVLMGGSEAIRFRRERAVETARTRAEEAERRASQERLRIAREIHDLVAHNMSMINVQASTALHLIDREPERAQVALEAIKSASKDALVELRSVLGVLRRADEDAPRSPTPGVDRLEELVANAAGAGLAVDMVVDGNRRPLPPTADLAAYRIVQEALTNITRHARATAATIRLEYGTRDLVVQVDDNGQGGPAGTSATTSATTSAAASAGMDGEGMDGNGIAGMRERAVVLGGTLQAGRRPEGGFRVRAWLPVGEGAT
jgi:signal transduction histidine kinase